jgi:hypothetical protein
MYETDMLEPLAIGNWTLKADVSDERRTRKTSEPRGTNSARGSNTANVTAASVMTVTMYQRARGGNSLSKTHQL